MGFYVLLWLAARRLPPGVRFVIAVLLEATWEVLENTPFVINRYRAATISLESGLGIASGLVLAQGRAAA